MPGKTLFTIIAFVLLTQTSILLYGQGGSSAGGTVIPPASAGEYGVAAPTGAPQTPVDAAKLNDTISDSLLVINEIMQISAKSIPTNMLARAQGLVIVPSMVKGGFVAGGAYGRGVFLTRQPNGPWSAPTFISMANGSVGFQVGIQSTDVVLVFCTKRSVDSFLNGKFTLGVDAAVAAGPIGRQASAGTDLALTSEVYSYSRSRGLFLGAAIDGGVLNINKEETARFYGAPGSPLPPQAAALVQAINNYSGLTANPAPQGAPASPTEEALKPQLAEAYKNLMPLLDDQWKAYLAIPPEFYAPMGTPLPTTEKVQHAIQNYQAVAANQQYKALYSRAEFQQVIQLLNQYMQIITAPTNAPAPSATAPTQGVNPPAGVN